MPVKITHDMTDVLLKELANAFRKNNGRKTFVELIIVGGGSILLNYGFRDMTDDFDIVSTANQALKDASIAIRDKYDLEYNWINSDFTGTASNSAMLRQVSTLYRSFNNDKFIVRTVDAEYLIAMKMISYRKYKSDRSDIVGVLKEEKLRGNNISKDSIQKAISVLYPEKCRDIIQSEAFYEVTKWCELDAARLEKLYHELTREEDVLALKLKEKAKEDPFKMTQAARDDFLKQAEQKIFPRPSSNKKPTLEEMLAKANRMLEVEKTQTNNIRQNRCEDMEL